MGRFLCWFFGTHKWPRWQVGVTCKRCGQPPTRIRHFREMDEQNQEQPNE